MWGSAIAATNTYRLLRLHTERIFKNALTSYHSKKVQWLAAASYLKALKRAPEAPFLYKTPGLTLKVSIIVSPAILLSFPAPSDPLRERVRRLVLRGGP